MDKSSECVNESISKISNEQKEEIIKLLIGKKSIDWEGIGLVLSMLHPEEHFYGADLILGCGLKYCNFCGLIFAQEDQYLYNGLSTCKKCHEEAVDDDCVYKEPDTLYTFSMIYAEVGSNLGLFYQESHTKSSLEKEDTVAEDILTRILEDMKPETLQIVDDRLMVVHESNRFVFREDLEGDSNYSLAVIPADDEEQIPFAPNITEEAAHGIRPFWYDGSGMRKVSDFNNFVEIVELDDEFFDEVRSMVKENDDHFTFYPKYLCFEEREIDKSKIASHMREVKVVAK